MTATQVACVDCFANTGFRNVLASIGGNPATCRRCGNIAPALNVDSLTEAMRTFFINGSYIAETMAPVYQMNDSNPNMARFDATLEADASLASALTGQIVFHYGPPLWRVGETGLKEEFDEGGARRAAALKFFISRAPRTILTPGTTLFRIRRNPEPDERIVTPQAFDPPPASVLSTHGRWDDGSAPVLYASDDIELCLHECRVTLSDEIVVGTLRCEREMVLLDLSAEIPHSATTPFEDPNIFATFLSLSRSEDFLDHARSVATAARQAGLAGIRYTSYYAQAKHSTSALNVALFGRPLQMGAFSLQSVNRVRIDDAQYQYAFGPVLYNDSQMQAELEA